MPRLDGIDGSHYQPDAGPVDLGVVAAIPTFWWAWKATQSTSGRDPTFAAMWAKAAPLFAQRLAYHWLSSTTDPVAQADHFLSVWDHTGGAMLDAEEAGITVAGALAWCERVEATTKRPCVVYSGLYVSGGTIWKSAALRTSAYGARPFIVAAYVSEANLAARLKATNSPDPHAWQYSSNGPVPGITGRCDMDMIHDRAAFDLACGLAATSPPPIETVPPVVVVPPKPSTEDTMLRLLAPLDSPARFFADCDPAGRARRCEWTGPGDDPAVAARIEFYRNATPAGQDFEMALHVDNLVNVSLDGPLPPGFKAEQFGNPDEIIARVTNTGGVDTTARAQIVALNDSVGRLGQRQATAGKDLADAGAALLGP